MIEVHLQGIGKENRAVDIVVNRFPFVIGRQNDCDYQLNHPCISRRHCCVLLKGEDVWIQDLESTNGTYLNRTRITVPQVLREDDWITLGLLPFSGLLHPGGNAMNKTRPEKSAILHLEGVIRRVDTLSREVTFLDDGALLRMVVSPDCSICLNGERVKLRLLQPGDQAEVAYTVTGPTAFAHSIEVNWLPRADAASRIRKKRKGLSDSCRDAPAARKASTEGYR